MRTFLRGRSGAAALMAAAISVTSGSRVEAGSWASLTRVEGAVDVLTDSVGPKDPPRGPAPHALYEGRIYSVRPASVGASLRPGGVVRARPGGRARVVYANGDQATIASGTELRFAGDHESALKYGEARFTIDPKGPRRTFRVRTPAATMGVRGTDFYVRAIGARAADVVVLAGKVRMEAVAASAPVPESVAAPASAPDPVIAEVSAGQTAGLSPPLAGAVETPPISVTETVRGDLRTLAENLKVAAPTSSATGVPLAAEVQRLEERSANLFRAELARVDVARDPAATVAAPLSDADADGGLLQLRLQEAPEGKGRLREFDSGVERLRENGYRRFFPGK